MSNPSLSPESCLERFLYPLSRVEFFAAAWEKAPRLIRRRRPGWYTGLLATSNLDAVLAHIREPHADKLLRVVKHNGTELLRESVPLTRYGAPDCHALYKRMTEGFTLVLNELDRRWAPISVLARGLEEAFGHRAGVNAYFTPSRSQGFLPHSDDHDVFILQLEGAKAWRLYEPLVELPTGEIPQSDILKCLGRPVARYELRVGDMLYIPRGWIHECATSGRPSLHLTIGVHVYRWIDFAQQALALAAAQNLELRRAIPGATLDGAGGQGALRAKWEELLGLLGGVDTGEAMAGVAAKLVESAPPPLDGRFARPEEAEGLSLGTTVSRRVGMRCAVSMRDRLSTIRFPGNAVSGPFTVDPALRYIAKTARFKVGDLPDSLDGRAKLVLVRRLIREGLLTKA